MYGKNGKFEKYGRIYSRGGYFACWTSALLPNTRVNAELQTAFHIHERREAMVTRKFAGSSAYRGRGALGQFLFEEWE